MNQHEDLIERLMISEAGWYEEHAPNTPVEARNSVMRDAAQFIAKMQEPVVVSVLEMKTSSIPDYYVSIRCGDRELTPYRHTVKGRAEFSAAEFQWLFHGGEKPNLADWLDRT